MNKELELESEKIKLEEVLNLLNVETLNYITKRKYIKEYILENRKRALEEYKEDEDKYIEYFDHETYVKEEAYKAIDKKLKELTILKKSPYFGKVTFSEEDIGVNDIYIGRFGVMKENGYEPVIIDWRAPIASLFYKGTLGEASYVTPEGEEQANIIGRRQLVIKKGELKGIFDSAIDVKDEILQMVLAENTSKNLQDIVMTIQKEQDEIIRAPKDKVIVVNGVAGSGKTTIALHRVSYLLYNYRKQFGDKILIFGPNDIFMDYISEVLPSLGESNVLEQTFESFALKEININYEIKGPAYYFEESIKGNETVKEEYIYKNSDAFLEFLDKKVDELNKNYFKIQDITFFNKVIVDVNEIDELFNKYYINMPLFRRSEKIKRILTLKIKDKRDEYVRKLNNDIKTKIESLSKEQYEIEKNDIEFKRRIRIREIIREVMNSRNRLDSFINHLDVTELYKKLTGTDEIGYVDLAGILYLKIKLEGAKYKKEIRHIVIDEAQDYSIVQFKVIKALTSCKSYTIVGDKNQRLVKVDDEPAMLNLHKIFDKDDIVNYELLKSYRSTKQIMDYASSFLDDKKVVPLVREGEEVLVENTENDQDKIETIISLIEDYEEDGLESIAVIVQDINELNKVSAMIKNKIKILTFDRDDLIYSGGKVIIPSYFAKGLEFDGVIIVENNKEVDGLIKYIMCTRALHRLSVVK
ncbi:HelD family protein [Clostridium sp. HCP1S3_B4]|uniref:HelD family protein n=1 Tax=unclassified Clostridium TaxID=2614128 RepID=UPI0016A9067D|nr:AAA family ATPase [Clostridiales bacterium]MDY2729607.1 AAA family ATPase [Clostridium sp.]NLK24400.1 AAA family ATPase [Clostridiales bacterium]